MSPRLWIWGFCPVRSRQESRSAHGRSRVRRHGRSLTGESATTTYSRSRVCGEARAPFLLSASRGRSAAPAAAPAAEIRRVPKSLLNSFAWILYEDWLAGRAWRYFRAERSDLLDDVHREQKARRCGLFSRPFLLRSGRCKCAKYEQAFTTTWLLGRAKTRPGRRMPRLVSAA